MNPHKGGFSFFVSFILFAICPGTVVYAQESDPPSRLDGISERKELRVCTTGDYKPFTYLSDEGEFSGIDIDLISDFAHALGVKPRFLKTTWPTLLQDFKAFCDIAVGGISITSDRQKEVFFTEPILSEGKTPIARCEDKEKYRAVDQINRPEVRIIVNPGGTNERFSRMNFPKAQLTIFSDNTTIFREIAENRADVMVTDSFETLLQQKLDGRLCAIHPEEPFNRFDKAFMLPYGDVSFKVRADRWLRLKKINGDFDRVKKKWLD